MCACTIFFDEGAIEITHFRAYVAQVISLRLCLEHLHTRLDHASHFTPRADKHAAIGVWVTTDAESRQWRPYPLVRGHDRFPHRQGHRRTKHARVAWQRRGITASSRRRTQKTPLPQSVRKRGVCACRETRGSSGRCAMRRFFPGAVCLQAPAGTATPTASTCRTAFPLRVLRPWLFPPIDQRYSSVFASAAAAINRARSLQIRLQRAMLRVGRAY